MSAISLNSRPGNNLGEMPPAGDIVELSLLLPSWQAAVLETAARDRGLTTAQMVRRLIREFFDHLNTFGPKDDWDV